jgi:putative ABC transport system permease protein
MNWWKTFFRKGAYDRQLHSEIRFHIEKLTEEKIAAGLKPDEARRQAVLEFGGEEQLKEELRDVYRIATVENTLANLKSAFRFLRKSPSFSAAVVLTLALGIGGNSAVFSAIDAIVLRPLPFPKGDQLVVIRQKNSKVKSSNPFVAPIRVEDWNRLNSTFQAITGYYTDDTTETSGSLPEKETLCWSAPRFLQVWGIAPAIGRDFLPEEQKFGGPSAVLISDRFWRRRFAADPNMAGKTVRLGKTSYRVAGVMPASFAFPVHDVDFWSPAPLDAPYVASRENTWYTVVGRLRDGVTLAKAEANLATVQAQLGKQFPKSDAELLVSVEPLKEQTIGGVRRSLWILFGSVSLVLLIACTNIASLLLARTADREHEISIRYSLGASRASIIVQLLTETLVLAFLGAVAGLLVGWGAAHIFRSLAKSLPRVEEITLDWRLTVYTLGCTLFATLLCGLFPAFHATRRNLSNAISQGSRTQVSARNPLQWLLVSVQVALAVTLLIGAGLLLRSFQELGRVNPGFDTSHVLTFRITANYGETTDMKRLSQKMERLVGELRTVPGVEAATTSGSLPGIPGQQQTELQITDIPSRPDRKILANHNFISQDYFAAMRIPVLAGETCRDGSPTNGAIVNHSFVNTYLSNSPAIGHYLEVKTTGFQFPSNRIQGIVADARENGINQAPQPMVYWCVMALPHPFYLIRTHGEPMALAETIRRKVHEIEPSRSVFDISLLEEHLYEALGENRLRTVLLSLFAFTAVALACVGLYGTLSYFVSVRRREIGLRLALGALRKEIIWRFLSQGFGIAILGCAAGLGMALAFTQLLSGMLYGVKPFDAETFGGVAILILVVAALASLVPSLRAAGVEPMQVLRNE